MGSYKYGGKTIKSTYRPGEKVVYEKNGDPIKTHTLEDVGCMFEYDSNNGRKLSGVVYIIKSGNGFRRVKQHGNFDNVYLERKACPECSQKGAIASRGLRCQNENCSTGRFNGLRMKTKQTKYKIPEVKLPVRVGSSFEKYDFKALTYRVGDEVWVCHTYSPKAGPRDYKLKEYVRSVYDSSY